MAVVYSIGSARTRAAPLRALAAAGLRAVAAQRGHLLPWAPVCLGAGIGAWFALPEEPGAAAYALLAGLGVLAALGARRLPEDVRPLAGALALMALGALLAGLRAHLQAAPVLEFRYYGPVEGRVVKIDRSASDALRLTLDRVVLEDVRPERVPRRVRVSLHGAQGLVRPEPGQVVAMTASLAPPPGPVARSLPAPSLDPRQHAPHPLFEAPRELAPLGRGQHPGDLGHLLAVDAPVAPARLLPPRQRRDPGAHRPAQAGNRCCDLAEHAPS